MIGRWLGIQKVALDHVKHSEGFKTTSEKATICIERKELTDKKCDQKGEKRHKMKFNMWGGDHPMAGGGRVMTAMTNRRMRVKCPETHFLSHRCSR